MKRILIDTQSNRLFRGIRREQLYDQRGGLCQVGAGHAVVTTSPIDPDYLEYWQGLGFSLPDRIVAGPFHPDRSLSELILHSPRVQDEIKRFAGDGPARIEFFCIEACEAQLSRQLAIPGYCNFDLSLRFSRKLAFKEICAGLGLSTPSWLFFEETGRLLEEGAKRIESGIPLIVKANDGMGGKACGSVCSTATVEELKAAVAAMSRPGAALFLEHRVQDLQAEAAIHWEITSDGKLNCIGLFDQVARNCSYNGVVYPSALPPQTIRTIRSQLKDRLAPTLIQQGAVGYYCCDLLIDSRGLPWWTDFNARKGAILYVWEAVRRLAELYPGPRRRFFRHEHIPVAFPPGTPPTFRQVAQRLDGMLTPGEKPFVLLTNPGVIEFGCIDLTGISSRSREEAATLFEKARTRLQQ